MQRDSAAGVSQEKVACDSMQKKLMGCMVHASVAHACVHVVVSVHDQLHCSCDSMQEKLPACSWVHGMHDACEHLLVHVFMWGMRA